MYRYVLRYVGILAAFSAMLPAINASGSVATGTHAKASNPRLAPLWPLTVPTVRKSPSSTAAEALEDPTKYFLTCLHLLVQVGLALKDLVLSFKGIAAARGLATRVDALLQVTPHWDPTGTPLDPTLTHPDPEPRRRAAAGARHVPGRRATACAACQPALGRRRGAGACRDARGRRAHAVGK